MDQSSRSYCRSLVSSRTDDLFPTVEAVIVQMDRPYARLIRIFGAAVLLPWVQFGQRLMVKGSAAAVGHLNPSGWGIATSKGSQLFYEFRRWASAALASLLIKSSVIVIMCRSVLARCGVSYPYNSNSADNE